MGTLYDCPQSWLPPRQPSGTLGRTIYVERETEEQMTTFTRAPLALHRESSTASLPTAPPTPPTPGAVSRSLSHQ